MIQTLGSESVSTIAERYRQLGYEVVLEPDASLLPKEARSLHPDLLAIKGDEHVIVEVKYQQNLLAYPALMRLADAIRRIPGWRLDVAVLEQPKKAAPLEPLSRKDAERRLNAAERVAKETEDYGAALLLLWTAIEAILRDQVRKQGEDSIASASRLPKVAYSLGLINEQDASIAEWMARIRHHVVHGGSKPPVSQSDYDRGLDFARRLFASNGNNEVTSS